jgi:hypothetical protein
MLVAQTVSVSVKSNPPFALQTLLGQSLALRRRGRHCDEKGEWGYQTYVQFKHIFFDNTIFFKSFNFYN